METTANFQTFSLNSKCSYNSKKD